MGYRQARYDEPLITEMGEAPSAPLDKVAYLPPEMLRSAQPRIPNLTEQEVVRHFTNLSQMNYGVENGIYPLGSCTMKYNPKVCEELAADRGVEGMHPLQPEETAQGVLRVMHELEALLCAIGGMDAVTLQPAAGAQGEYTGLLIARAYYKEKGEERTEVVLPDTAHGTNPASAAMAGYDVVEIPSKNGCVDIQALESAVSECTAAFMLTNPNTLGIFEDKVLDIAGIVHDAGALLYYDGANMNAIMGRTSPGAMGFDIVHYNLHKTFATPHGGGGPGAGPVGVKAALEQYLPVPRIAHRDGVYRLDYDRPHSIGKVRSFYGNLTVLLRAYAYILLLGSDGLKKAAERAVLNSNYLCAKLASAYEMPFRELRKHEFVLSGAGMKKKGLRTMDLAKRLLDYGFHAPTIYFPLIVDEAMMIEPTESETKASLDKFADAMLEIIEEGTEIVRSAPHNTAVGRLDEVKAAKNLVLRAQEIR
ncbi:MAG: aminomethyl-transferring glycine dehydrogenase subunit GcvPB [Candidatus Thermoplasmatota archaeon]